MRKVDNVTQEAVLSLFHVQHLGKQYCTWNNCTRRLPECLCQILSSMENYTTGLLEAPTDVSVDQVSVESVTVSWSPPFTLDGVPILQYTVYVTSKGRTEVWNTTEMQITLERPHASTTYQISAWNRVGEGNASRYGELLELC